MIGGQKTEYAVCLNEHKERVWQSAVTVVLSQRKFAKFGEI